MNNEIDEFYMLRKNYKNQNKNRCINCNRSVGTNFSIEYFTDKRILKVVCGDTVNPCELKKEVIIVKDFNTMSYVNELKKEKQEMENDILKLKNKLLYELINETEYDKLFNEINSKYMRLVKELEIRINNIEKEVYENNKIKNSLKEIIEENNEYENSDEKIFNILNNIVPTAKVYKEQLKLIAEENGNYRLKEKI